MPMSTGVMTLKYSVWHYLLGNQERMIYNVYAHVDHLSAGIIGISYLWFLILMGNFDGLLGISMCDQKCGKILQKIDRKLHLGRHCLALTSLFWMMPELQDCDETGRFRWSHWFGFHLQFWCSLHKMECSLSNQSDHLPCVVLIPRGKLLHQLGHDTCLDL